MQRVAIVIPTWNNIQYLVQTIRSLRERTVGVEYRIIVVPNGCTDGTYAWLEKEKIESVPFGESVGFVRATNAGLGKVQESEHVLWLNDDVRITDPGWLFTLVRHFEDEKVGAVGPVSNFVMGTQDFRLDNLPLVHEAPFLIGFCLLVRKEAFKKVGLIDDRYGIGTNDDLDYSMSLRDKGYKLLVDRNVFLWHYGARSIVRKADYDKLQLGTRELLKQKWGSEKTTALLYEMKKIVDQSRRGTN
jgi:GT2 family glycosyltransferase